jgi:hypothetical protein
MPSHLLSVLDWDSVAEYSVHRSVHTHPAEYSVHQSVHTLPAQSLSHLHAAFPYFAVLVLDPLDAALGLVGRRIC